MLSNHCGRDFFPKKNIKNVFILQIQKTDMESSTEVSHDLRFQGIMTTTMWNSKYNLNLKKKLFCLF